MVVGEEGEDGVVGAGDVGVMTDVASEPSVGVLAPLEPLHDLCLFSGGKGLLEGCEGSEGPVPSCDFEVLGEVLSDGVEVLAVVEGQEVLDVLLPVKFDGLAFHYYIYPVRTRINSITCCGPVDIK